MPASRERVIRSPRLAAMGVATLSGLMPTFLDAMITPIMMRPTRVGIEFFFVTWFSLKYLPFCYKARRNKRSHVTDSAMRVPRMREAMKAVATLEAHSSTAWPSLMCPSGIQPKITAAMEARNPTTVAWTYTNTHALKCFIFQCSQRVLIGHREPPNISACTHLMVFLNTHYTKKYNTNVCCCHNSIFISSSNKESH